MFRITTFIFLLLFLFSSAAIAATGVSGDSQINLCEQKSYIIALSNNTGNDVTDIVIENDLSLLTGFSYVVNSSDISTSSNSQSCSVTGVNPASSGSTNTYTIDALCGGAFTLEDGGTISIEYVLLTDCDAVSGSNVVTVDYLLSGTPAQESGQLSIEVLPGAMTIKKTPAVLAAAIGDSVSWTITVENSGLGTVKNVQVTDVLGSGLQYLSTSLSGINSGQTTTWSPSEVPAFAEMAPGDVVSLTLEAEVIGCDGLDNTADVQFGCSATTCFDTSVDGGTATASIQRIVRTPLLDFLPPDITFDYCGGSVPDPVTLTIDNIGDGDAYDVQTLVDFDPLIVTVTSPDAGYDAGAHAFSLVNPIAAGGSYNLQFTLEQPVWCSAVMPDSPLLWYKVYKDECDNDFYPPVELSVLTPPADGPSVAVSKTGAPAEIQIGDQISYTITSSYSGVTSCGGGATGNVMVVDTIPDGFTVVDVGGGAWTPGVGGTGGEIVWSYDPSSSLDTDITLQSPGVSDCETYCYTTFTNTVSATVTDCCDCDLSATASQTTAIECEPADVSSDKSVIPITTERCDILSYTNVYTFGATSSALLSDLTLTEHAEQGQTYVANSLTVSLGGSSQSCTVVSQSGAGDPVVIDFSACPATLLSGQLLTITYDLEIHEDSGGGRCTDASFYSWSSLDLGSGSGGECLVDGIIHETTEVGIQAPAMNLSLNGLGATINTCEEKTVTIDLTQSSTIANPRDVTLVLSGLNYYVTDPVATTCTGISPVSCTPTITGDGDYHWDFNDAFSGVGQAARIELAVQKRCSGASELAATVYFDDNCSDDATSDEICSVTASDTPALLTRGDLIVTKTPEIYHAETNEVEWVIYLTNRGAGTAYNVWVDDVLGSGLVLLPGTSTVDPNTGVTVTENIDHQGGAINGVSFQIVSMAPGEKREIRVSARLTSCSNLTNDVTASWGCIGASCQTEVTDSSEVVIPTPNLVYTTIFSSSALAPCADYVASISVKNAGQTTVYNVVLNQSLPVGMSFVAGSTRWRLNGGAWNGPGAGYDPNPATSPLEWSSAEISGLASLSPGDVLQIEYTVSTSCGWAGGNAQLTGQYENPCGDVYSSGVKTFALSADEPDIALVKRRVTPADSAPLDCGQSVIWEIDVTNNSGYTIELIRVSDTIGDAFEDISSTDSNSAQISTTEIQWEIGNLAANATTTLHIGADTTSAPICGSDLDNTVELLWGCGIANGDPTDDSGVECLNSTTTTETHTSSRRPAAGLLSLGFSPANIDSCNDSTTMTFVYENVGPTDAVDLDLAINLPAGISYNPGTAYSGLGTDQAAAAAALGAIAEPAVSGSTLTFYDSGDHGNNLTNLLQAAGGNDTLVLQFNVSSSCYEGGSITGSLYFYDCCGTEQYTSTFDQVLDSNEPDLVVTKTPLSSQIDCAENQSWEITVTNNGSGNAEVVRIEDIPGSWLTVVPAGSDGVTDMGGGVWGWEFNDLAAGTSQSRTLLTTLSPGSEGCDPSYRQNNASVFWGCGTTGDAGDTDPTTTGYDCQASSSVSADTTGLQMPDLEITAVSPTIGCGPDDGTLTGSLEVSITNNGDGDNLSNFSVQVTIDGSAVYSGVYTGTLGAGASDTLTIPTPGWNPDCNGCNSYSFAAVIDSAGDVCECDETNNSFSETYSAQIPKLEVTDITAVLSCNGESFVDVTVANSGCVDVAAGVEIEITGDIVASGVTVGSLVAVTGEEIVRISLGTPDCDDDYTITATVDPNGAICECSGDNHQTSTTFTLPCCEIDLEKATNNVDADTPTGPYIPEGDTVTWSYVIENRGSTDIRIENLTDNQNGSLTICEGGNTIPFVLAAGDSVTCLDSATVSQALMGDQYANSAVVNGTPLDSGGNPIGANLTDTDPSHFHVEIAGIAIEKLTNGDDADTVTGPLIGVGQSVNWEYRVTNTGNAPLADIDVTDDRGVVVSCPTDTLNVGVSMICTGSGLAQIGQYENIASVTGTPPTGVDVTDSDPSHYFGVNAAIDIEKLTNSEDADNLPGPYIPTGDPVSWEYLVTNTGNVELTGIVVTDDQGVVVTCPGDTLVAGDVMTCTGSGISDTLQYANSGSVVGTPPSGTDVTDTDPSHYYSAQPAIALEKLTNGEDADSPTGPLVQEGSKVEWSYLVTNTGDVTINDISVTDSRGVAVSCPGSSLDSGQSMTCTGYGKAEVGQYENLATVTGQPVAGPEVTDSDPSHYIGYKDSSGPGGRSKIELTKTVQPESLREGGIITYSVFIKNSGNVASTMITVVDTLPDGFGYVPSSSRLDGSKIGDPSGLQTLTWKLDSVEAGGSKVLSYQVQAPLVLIPGRYLNSVYTLETEGNDTDVGVHVSPSSDHEECCLSVDKELSLFNSRVDVIPVKRDLYYHTHSAMLLAYELAGLSHITVDDDIYQYKVSSQRQRVLELVNRYAAINVASLSMRSGLGFGMEYCPEFSDGTVEERQANLQFKLEQLAGESNYQGDVSIIRPLLLEYYGAVPLKKSSDVLVWDKSAADESLNPMTLGMAILANSVELRRLQTSRKKEDAFIAAVLNWQLEQKVVLLGQYLKELPEEARYFPQLFASLAPP